LQKFHVSLVFLKIRRVLKYFLRGSKLASTRLRVI
jgi:hypothetical protein